MFDRARSSPVRRRSGGLSLVMGVFLEPFFLLVLREKIYLTPHN